MPKGLSLHIGLNSVDGGHYDGWTGDLNACEADAKDMTALARKAGFKPTTLLTKAATAAAVKSAFGKAAVQLVPGDIFLVSYSGHGGQVRDTNGDEKDDHEDETWVLYDRELVDDEIYSMLGGFKRGVRVLVLSDSCHSGTVTRALAEEFNAMHNGATPGLPEGVRAMPEEVAMRVYRSHQKLYDKIQRETPPEETVSVGATVLLISGCQDGQLSSDGDRNGLFTATLKQVWNKGKFKQSYMAFHKEIARNMPLYQKPNYFKVGTPNILFEREKPFTV